MTCFYCNKHFRNWKEGQDPWIEHGRWSTQCYYILIMKGSDFINNTRSSMIIKRPPQMFTNEIIMKMMNKLDILVTLSKSYKRDFLKKVFKDSLILTRGRPFKSYDHARYIITDYLCIKTRKFKKAKIIDESNQKGKGEVENKFLTSVDNDTLTLTRTYNERNITTYHISDPKCNQIWSFTIENLKCQQPAVLPRCQHDKLFSTRCNICQDRERCILILPCQHFCVCEFCLLQLRNCPICRILISHVTKVYFS